VIRKRRQSRCMWTTTGTISYSGATSHPPGSISSLRTIQRRKGSAACRRSSVREGAEKTGPAAPPPAFPEGSRSRHRLPPALTLRKQASPIVFPEERPSRHRESGPGFTGNETVRKIAEGRLQSPVRPVRGNPSPRPIYPDLAPRQGYAPPAEGEGMPPRGRRFPSFRRDSRKALQGIGWTRSLLWYLRKGIEPVPARGRVFPLPPVTDRSLR
jgi:hypothetical protein